MKRIIIQVRGVINETYTCLYDYQTSGYMPDEEIINYYRKVIEVGISNERAKSSHFVLSTIGGQLLLSRWAMRRSNILIEIID